MRYLITNRNQRNKIIAALKPGFFIRNKIYISHFSITSSADVLGADFIQKTATCECGACREVCVLDQKSAALAARLLDIPKIMCFNFDHGRVSKLLSSCDNTYALVASIVGLGAEDAKRRIIQVLTDRRSQHLLDRIYPSIGEELILEAEEELRCTLSNKDLAMLINSVVAAKTMAMMEIAGRLGAEPISASLDSITLRECSLSRQIAEGAAAELKTPLRYSLD